MKAGLDHRLVHLPDSRAAFGHKILIRNAVRCDTLPLTRVLGETMIKAKFFDKIYKFYHRLK
jgi:hypothetical protein